VVIVSGLALGIDAIAHKAALEAGGGIIVVLAHGLDTIQPATNYALAKRIVASGGVLVSEYPARTPPVPLNFIARNRLVSGLSDGVLITEAAARSGTMHTANFALEQGKTVMSVPGSIFNPLSEGTNNLIKTGAVPVTTSRDVLFALGLSEARQPDAEVFGDNEAETAILRLLRQGVSETAELLTKTGLDTATFNQAVTMLEINGKIRPLGGGQWTLL
jgi:DNA processing protein